MQLILASTSRYRRELLGRLGLPFSCVPPQVDEAILPGETATALVARLALAKARAVAEQHPDSIVIGSDQVAVLGDSILGKSGDYATACRQLSAASGNRVVFQTGLCVISSVSGQTQQAVVPFTVVFRQLSAGQIDSYVRREQPYDCAGSFKSEGLGICLFEKMQGDDPTALIGLPLITLTGMLQHAGMPVL